VLDPFTKEWVDPYWSSRETSAGTHVADKLRGFECESARGLHLAGAIACHRVELDMCVDNLEEAGSLGVA